MCVCGVAMQVTTKVIRGEQTRFRMFCPSEHGRWIGPLNQTLETNRSSGNIMELILDRLTLADQGIYLCQDNRTDEILRRYQLTIGSMRTILLPFVLLMLTILLLWPIFCCLGRKYSGLNQ